MREERNPSSREDISFSGGPGRSTSGRRSGMSSGKISGSGGLLPLGRRPAGVSSSVGTAGETVGPEISVSTVLSVSYVTYLYPARLYRAIECEEVTPSS